VRRGAASRAVLGSCSAAAARAAAQVSSPRSRHGWPSAPRRWDPGEVWPPSGWSPVARMSGRRPRRSSPVRVLCPPCGRPSDRSSGRPSDRSRGRPVSTRPVSRRPVPSRCPDGRASGVRGSAAVLSAPGWTLEWLGAAGRPRWAQWVRRAAVVRGRRGRLPASDLTGRDGAALAVGGSHEGRRQTWAAASHAHRLRRRGRQGSWSSARMPVGWLGNTRTSRCAQYPRGGPWAGCRRGARPWGWTGRW
jgi:hypothetical protein